MRRTLEKLAKERQRSEDEFLESLESVRTRAQNLHSELESLNLQDLSSRLEELRKNPQRRRPAPRRGKGVDADLPPDSKLLQILEEMGRALEGNLALTNTLIASLGDLSRKGMAMVDAKDREMDALGSNHVGKIFKSMEWRVDKLAALYEDVGILMRSFLQTKEKLTSLLSTLESGRKADPRHVKELLAPLEDWRYTGFENRFRGSRESIRAQQEPYLKYFSSGKILDLGCGRGEFLSLLAEKGLEAEGVDLNDQMLASCREQGLRCQRQDILEALSGFEDGSLGGIFSSQVIEHLSPEYLTRLVELSYIKLSYSGRLVLETVNPLSVFALVHVYFLDSSHRKPVHPQALKYLLESAGFEEVEIHYSHPLDEERLEEIAAEGETGTILNRNIDKLNALLYAPSNFAAVGLKK
jgi:SAM-dependent methyltransferase